MALYSTRALRVLRNSSQIVATSEIGDGLPPELVSEWRQQLALYDQYWAWMDGKVWDQVDRYFVSQKGQELPLLFPLQLNPIYTAALIHRNALFGEAADTGNPMVQPVAIPKNKYGDGEEGITVTPEARTTARQVTDLLEGLWYQSNSRASMLDAGFISQALGGTVFKVSYEPYNTFLDPAYPVAFREIEPEFFLPVYGMYDRWNLIEARIGRMIDGYEAKRIYNVETTLRKVLYLETWSRNELKVTVNNEPASIQRDGKWYPLSHDHNYGFVPVVYIPHEIIGQFYGVPIVHQIGNLVKEFNGRAADIGDAVRNSIERMYILTNADANELKIKHLESGIKVMASGKEMAGTQAKRVDHVAPPDLPQGTMDYLKFLRDSIWHGSSTPAVAYGEDEGSQRSALTLAFRMWPLTSHIRAERSLWTEGMRVLGQMALKILSMKQDGEGAYKNVAEGTPYQVTDKHLGHILKMDWAPMIPRDRESEVNQLILRHQDEQLSTRMSLEKQGDIDDVDAELKEIVEEREEKAKLEAKYAVQIKGTGAPSDTQQDPARAETE
jgi:hypothetical protein